MNRGSDSDGPATGLDNGGERGHGSRKDRGRAAYARPELTLNGLTKIKLQAFALELSIGDAASCQNGTMHSDDHHEMRRLLL
jgi:hypothetical protein